MLTPDHPFYEQFVNLLNRLRDRKVLDVGTSQRFAKELAPYHNFFREYHAAGLDPDRTLDDPCDFDEDITSMTFPNGSFGGIICLEVLEHVYEFHKAVKEIHRILEKDGELVLSVPFLTGYHGHHKGPQARDFQLDSSHKGYSDYFRFTHEALYKIFYDVGFQNVTVYPVDGPVLARLEFMLPRGRARPFYRFASLFDHPALGRATTRHFVHAVK